MACGSVYTLPAGADFLQSLARGLKQRFGVDAPHALVLLPTRRACIYLREAFLKDSGESNDLALLLPDIRPLGEVDEEELALSAGPDFLREVMALPPAIDPLRRQMLLAGMVLETGMPGLTRTQAFSLAVDLGRLIDDALIEECALDRLATLVEEKEYAEHWQKIVHFLHIVTMQWPEKLRAEGAIDAVDRRQRLTRLLIAHWRQNPPDYPVIAAGSTGSQPVTAELLKTISSFPRGAVVLPGLDQHVEEEAWALLESSHPHCLLARLLKKLECERDAVKPWFDDASGSEARRILMSEIMRPSQTTDRWRFLRPGEIAPEAWHGLEVIEAAHEHEEAFIAALMLRQVAEGDETAALITPDRAIAKRVAALMRRWNIHVNDSAGTPLLETPAGSYLSLLLELPSATLRPSQLMAFFKHPFAGMGMAREALLALSRNMESDFFRNQPRGQGLENWARLLKHDPAHQLYAALVEKIHAALRDFSDSSPRSFSEWLRIFQICAEDFCIDKNYLWHEREGETLADLFESLAMAGDTFSCTYSEFADMLRQALRGQVVRRPWGQHPRLAILGLLEARLLRFDRVILAGLNEGTWPETQRADPWMSPAMRVDLGCADPDQRLGQMAHDFTQQAAGKNVVLLRSKRKGEAPTIPSRWLRRLEAVRELVNAAPPAPPWAAWVHAVDFPKTIKACEPPAVSIPVSAFPNRLSPSAIELWMRDPYAFYARYVLKLEAHGALDAEFSVRERGTLIHRALEKLAIDYPDEWPETAIDGFVSFIRQGLASYGCSGEAQAILSARLHALARSYWTFEQSRRRMSKSHASEVKALQKMQLDEYAFDITARADRMDELNEDGLSILDYKTSGLPTKTEREALLKPQLFIEAVLADNGAFSDAPKTKVAEIAYVHFDQNQGDVYQENLDLPEGAIEKIHAPGLIGFIRAFLAEDARFHAVPRPLWCAPAPDYARLARVAEWSSGAVVQEKGKA